MVYMHLQKESYLTRCIKYITFYVQLVNQYCSSKTRWRHWDKKENMIFRLALGENR